MAKSKTKIKSNVVNVTTTTKKTKTETILEPNVITRMSDEDFDIQVTIRKIENIIKMLRDDANDKLNCANKIEESLNDVMSNKAPEFFGLYDLLELSEVIKNENHFGK